MFIKRNLLSVPARPQEEINTSILVRMNLGETCKNTDNENGY